MKTTNEKLFQCFESLQYRIYTIKNSKLNPNLELKDWYAYHHPINDITAVIFSVHDLETAEDHLNHYIGVISKLIEDLSSIVLKFKYSDDLEGIFQNPTLITKAAEVKKQFRKKLLLELKFYKDELKQILESVLEKFNHIKDFNFANDKIRLDMNGKEIGSFFNLLYDIKLIDHKRTNGKDFSKGELARFICSSFDSTNSSDMKVISMTNNLSRKDQNAEVKVCEILNKLLEYAETPYQSPKRNPTHKANTTKKFK